MRLKSFERLFQGDAGLTEREVEIFLHAAVAMAEPPGERNL